MRASASSLRSDWSLPDALHLLLALPAGTPSLRLLNRALEGLERRSAEPGWRARLNGERWGKKRGKLTGINAVMKPRHYSATQRR
jgi:hypothetical protein